MRQTNAGIAERSEGKSSATSVYTVLYDEQCDGMTCSPFPGRRRSRPDWRARCRGTFSGISDSFEVGDASSYKPHIGSLPSEVRTEARPRLVFALLVGV